MPKKELLLLVENLLDTKIIDENDEINYDEILQSRLQINSRIIAAEEQHQEFREIPNAIRYRLEKINGRNTYFCKLNRKPSCNTPYHTSYWTYIAPIQLLRYKIHLQCLRRRIYSTWPSEATQGPPHSPKTLFRLKRGNAAKYAIRREILFK